MELTKDFIYPKKESNVVYIDVDRTISVGCTHSAVKKALEWGSIESKSSWVVKKYLVVTTAKRDFYISCTALKDCPISRSASFCGQYIVIPVKECYIIYK